jgi:hypothetical protein
MSAHDPKRPSTLRYRALLVPDGAWRLLRRRSRPRFVTFQQKCRRTADYRRCARATSLFVGDDNLLLRRIDDEYGQQPSRLRRAGVGAHLMVVAGHLRPAFSCLVDMFGLVVDLATQDRLATVAADAAVSHTATVPATFGAETTAVFDRPSESQYPPSVAKSEIARQVVSDRTSMLQPESAAQAETLFKPSVQPKFANQAQSVPLPTRKPKKPGTAVAKRIVRQQAKEEPNPMRFGSFGFNYTDPAQ